MLSLTGLHCIFVGILKKFGFAWLLSFVRISLSLWGRIDILIIFILLHVVHTPPSTAGASEPDFPQTVSTEETMGNKSGARLWQQHTGCGLHAWRWKRHPVKVGQGKDLSMDPSQNPELYMDIRDRDFVCKNRGAVKTHRNTFFKRAEKENKNEELKQCFNMLNGI